MVAQFEGGPLADREYDVGDLPDWLWYAHDPTPPEDLEWAPIYTRAPVSPVRYHRYQMVSGVYHHTGQHRQITTYSGDAWLHLTRHPHTARIVRIPHPEEGPQ